MKGDDTIAAVIKNIATGRNSSQKIKQHIARNKATSRKFRTVAFFMKAAESVEKKNERSIIVTSSHGGNEAVHFVGRINRDFFQAITIDATTDEVIITDERIEHSNLHDNAYTKYGDFVPIVLAEPDFAFRANKPNTAVLIKQIRQDGKNLQLVLRIHVSTDDPSFKNSIISFWDISETRRKNYERNKEIIYRKKEM